MGRRKEGKARRAAAAAAAAQLAPAPPLQIPHPAIDEYELPQHLQNGSLDIVTLNNTLAAYYKEAKHHHIRNAIEAEAGRTAHSMLSFARQTISGGGTALHWTLENIKDTETAILQLGGVPMARPKLINELIVKASTIV